MRILTTACLAAVLAIGCSKNDATTADVLSGPSIYKPSGKITTVNSDYDGPTSKAFFDQHCGQQVTVAKALHPMIKVGYKQKVMERQFYLGGLDIQSQYLLEVTALNATDPGNVDLRKTYAQAKSSDGSLQTANAVINKTGCSLTDPDALKRQGLSCVKNELVSGTGTIQDFKIHNCTFSTIDPTVTYKRTDVSYTLDSGITVPATVLTIFTSGTGICLDAENNLSAAAPVAPTPIKLQMIENYFLSFNSKADTAGDVPGLMQRMCGMGLILQHQRIRNADTNITQTENFSEVLDFNAK